MPQSRQLAAIMFTDIVGYTASMGEDEQKAFDLLRKNRQIQQPLIKQFKGTWIKELGDGVLASFHTATDAVLCAGKIQKASASVPGLRLRIGIHLGDVVFENHDVFGDSVNIASRIQALAPSGGIWVSESVYKNIANKKGIHSRYVTEETLKNVKEGVKIYEVQIEDSEIEQLDQVHPRGHTPKTAKVTTKKKKFILLVASALAVLFMGLVLIPRWINIKRARNELIPEIQKMAEASFFPPTKAFDLAIEAEQYLSNDSALNSLWPKIAWPVSYTTEPAGANLYWKDYNDLDGEWKLIGKTPLKKAWIPHGFPRIKIEKQGFHVVYSPNFFSSELSLKLDSTGTIPANMVKVYGSESPMFIIGLESHGGRWVQDFLMDKYEVTNKEFKQFIDAGGYRNKKYWDYKIYSEGKEISWDTAIAQFRDKTGRPGPAGWEAGTYPDGKAEHPVTGLSWYEAMAYAKYAGKKLPTVFHWSQVANTWSTWEIIPRSNFNSTGTVPVGSLDAISFWGVYDIAGNAREWCFNESDKKGEHYILGGGWNDPTYAYNDGHAEPAIDRSLSNGFRCMKDLPGDTTYGRLGAMLEFAFRDYTSEKPVHDEIFNIFLRQFAYDKSSLSPHVVQIADSNLCKIEKINIAAAYKNETLSLYLFLPKNSKPPYQTILYFPGSGAIRLKKFDFRTELGWLDFVLKSGRAVCYPVLKGTFERGDELNSDFQNESISYKEHVIAWVQDCSRSLDYLETRNDIQHKKFGFYGFSWGGEMGPVVCASENRFKAAVFHVGGLMMQKTFPEVDPINYLPRVTIPVLMLNGKNDTFFPVEASQKPMFRFLGTPAKNKKMIIYEGGHIVPRSELIRETLSWFDEYLGPVQ